MTYLSAVFSRDLMNHINSLSTLKESAEAGYGA